MSDKRTRDAKTGEFVPAEEAERHPDTTVQETVRPSAATKPKSPQKTPQKTTQTTKTRK